MFAPGGSELAGGDVGHRAGLDWPQLAPRLIPLVHALSRLVAVSDSVAEAVIRHDRRGLEECNERAALLLAEVERIAATLTPDERDLVDEAGIPALRERLAEASRRNAFLIEQAWAVDAALMRLLIGAGKNTSEGPASGYQAAQGPAYVDRGA
jgi:hypothetical protein